jgi:polypeptide N-acetylgalactosaminyltransferase
MRSGPGEQGQGVTLTAEEARSSQKAALYSSNGFNAFVSDKISLQRSLNDIRHPE